MDRDLFVRKMGVLASLGLFFMGSMGLGFDAADTFEKKCSSCHSIGGGDDVGPDLKGVTERRDAKWLVKFVQSSQSVIQSGDAAATELFNKFKQKKMPDQDLSEADVTELMAFVKTGGAGSGKASENKSALKATPDEIATGMKLFSGEVRLSAGGPSCISCHTAGRLPYLGGGALGPDLTSAYSNYNDAGLSKVLSKISFPTMVGPYTGKALTVEEVYALKSFLYTTDKAGPVIAGYEKKFMFLGILGLFAGLGVIDISWRTRRKKSSRPTAGGKK